MSARRVPQQHIKIAEHLRGRILSGEIPAGSLLPSEAELCEEFDTSRGPVRQALASLRTEGFISSGRGRRSVVLGHEKLRPLRLLFLPTTGLNPTVGKQAPRLCGWRAAPLLLM